MGLDLGCCAGSSFAASFGGRRRPGGASSGPSGPRGPRRPRGPPGARIVWQWCAAAEGFLAICTPAARLRAAAVWRRARLGGGGAAGTYLFRASLASPRVTGVARVGRASAAILIGDAPLCPGGLPALLCCPLKMQPSCRSKADSDLCVHQSVVSVSRWRPTQIPTDNATVLAGLGLHGHTGRRRWWARPLRQRPYSRLACC